MGTNQNTFGQQNFRSGKLSAQRCVIRGLWVTRALVIVYIDKSLGHNQGMTGSFLDGYGCCCQLGVCDHTLASWETDLGKAQQCELWGRGGNLTVSLSLCSAEWSVWLAGPNTRKNSHVPLSRWEWIFPSQAELMEDTLSPHIVPKDTAASLRNSHPVTDWEDPLSTDQLRRNQCIGHILPEECWGRQGTYNPAPPLVSDLGGPYLIIFCCINGDALPLS